MRRLAAPASCALAASLLLSCSPAPAPRPASASPAILEEGRAAYAQYCRPCHGAEGRGDGPASLGMRPPPRDFSVAQFKFGWVIEGLPPDAELARIVREGLHGTAMAPWRVPERSLDAILQHVKTFDAEAWGTLPLGRPVEPPRDPWGAGRADEARARGSLVYHGIAQCHSCHPAFVSREEVRAARAAMVPDEPAVLDVRERVHEPSPGPAEPSGRPGASAVLPPDFTLDALRSVRPASRREDLYRVIAAGIPGTRMPTWDGALPPDDLWALAWYVDSLCDLRDRPEGRELRARLRSGDGAAASAGTPETSRSRTPPDAAPAAPAPG